MGRPRLVAGLHFYCGWCAGHGTLPCDYCYEGTDRNGDPCAECKTREGRVQCPECQGSPMLVPVPDWVPAPPETPQPPRCHHADTWRDTGAEGAGRVRRRASRLSADPTPEA